MKIAKSYISKYIGISNEYRSLPKVFEENKRVRSLLRCVLIILTYRILFFINNPKLILHELLYKFKVWRIKTFRRFPKGKLITEGDLNNLKFFIIDNKLVGVYANIDDNTPHEFPENYVI